MTDEQRIADYVRRLGWSLQRLDPAERNALIQEIRSHLTDSASGDTGSLDRAFAGFGTPYALGRRFVEEYELAGAVSGSGPGRLLVALLGRSRRRVVTTAAVFAAILCYVFAATFAVLAMAKPFVPGHVGAWRHDGDFAAGLVAMPPAGPELLGWWVVPIALALAIGSYLLGTGVLRLTGRRLLA
jgi:hypothetical protein